MKKKGLIGTVSNYKGGTGKTTSTVHLAASLAAKKKKVLIIDGDPQSNATHMVIHRDTSINYCYYHLMNPEIQNKPNIEECIYPTIHSDLYLLPNITETSGLEIPLIKNYPECDFYLRNSIRDYVVNNYDYAFIDCPPTLSIFVSNALFASDFVMIPMIAGSGNSLNGIKGVLDLMEAVKGGGNPDLKFLKILINQIDKRKGAHKANVSIVEERFGKKNIFKNSIPTSAVFETVESVGHETIFSYSLETTRSKGAIAFRNLSKEFLTLFK